MQALLQAITKNGTDHCWDEQCEAAFQSLKIYLASPPLLSKPLPDETLFLYLIVSDKVVSTFLVWEDEGIQKPVYYVNKSLIYAQTRYTRIEKLIFALFVTTRKLKITFNYSLSSC